MADTTFFWSMAGLLGLGAFHGINPGMGWLFAVALGLQEQRRKAVWQALLPLALGHGLAIAAAIIVAAALGQLLPLGALQWMVAGILAGLGAYRLYRHRHPAWRGMRVGMTGLTLWSFLMASAHGAGLMVLPIFLRMSDAAHHAGHGAHVQASGEPMAALLATLVHGAGYLLVTAVVAVVVFEKLGVGLLRKAWVNLDLIWAAALLATGGLTLLL